MNMAIRIVAAVMETVEAEEAVLDSVAVPMADVAEDATTTAAVKTATATTILVRIMALLITRAIREITPGKKHELSDEYIADAAQRAHRTVGLQNHFENVKLNLAPEKLDQYMKNGLCFKCGDKHLFDECPKLFHNRKKNKTQ